MSISAQKRSCAHISPQCLQDLGFAPVRLLRREYRRSYGVRRLGADTLAKLPVPRGDPLLAFRRLGVCRSHHRNHLLPAQRETGGWAMGRARLLGEHHSFPKIPSLRSLYCNSRNPSQAARKPVRAGLRKGIKTGKLKTGKWDVVLYSCLQSSCLPWFLGCGLAALCLLRLFAAERLSPHVPSDGRRPL